MHEWERDRPRFVFDNAGRPLKCMHAFEIDQMQGVPLADSFQEYSPVRAVIQLFDAARRMMAAAEDKYKTGHVATAAANVADAVAILRAAGEIADRIDRIGAAKDG